MTQAPTFRRAQVRDAKDLARVAYAAKAHWGYPAEWLAIWKSDLEPSPEDIETHWFLVCELASEVLGFVAVFDLRDNLDRASCPDRATYPDHASTHHDHTRPPNQAGNHGDSSAEAEIEHLWVRPDYMGRGIGRELMTRAVHWAREQGFEELRIVSDPNACSFYESLGAKQIGRLASLPPPRELPVLVLDLRHPQEARDSGFSRPRDDRTWSLRSGDVGSLRKDDER